VTLDEFICLAVVSQPGESQAAFASRLSRFWTHMLRNFKSDFEKVYAETTAFEEEAGRLSRKYLAGDEVISLLERELPSAGLDHELVDRDDRYSRYEAVAPDWMQIEH
jgi:hypothetical protein